ncbi:hypothetical protein HK096_008947 [Nowakowskiella sp. JEL0078]|nr:hypothetical protein HK096_008947 [Nowakowskiella sp. JEL0078]
MEAELSFDNDLDGIDFECFDIIVEQEYSQSANQVSDEINELSAGPPLENVTLIQNYSLYNLDPNQSIFVQVCILIEFGNLLIIYFPIFLQFSQLCKADLKNRTDDPEIMMMLSKFQKRIKMLISETIPISAELSKRATRPPRHPNQIPNPLLSLNLLKASLVSLPDIYLISEPSQSEPEFAIWLLTHLLPVLANSDYLAYHALGILEQQISFLHFALMALTYFTHKQIYPYSFSLQLGIVNYSLVIESLSAMRLLLTNVAEILNSIYGYSSIFGLELACNIFKNVVDVLLILDVDITSLVSNMDLKIACLRTISAILSLEDIKGKEEEISPLWIEKIFSKYSFFLQIRDYEENSIETRFDKTLSHSIEIHLAFLKNVRRNYPENLCAFNNVLQSLSDNLSELLDIQIFQRIKCPEMKV